MRTSLVAADAARRAAPDVFPVHAPIANLSTTAEIALQNRTTQQKLVAEALNYIFEKHNRPKIAAE